MPPKKGDVASSIKTIYINKISFRRRGELRAERMLRAKQTAAAGKQVVVRGSSTQRSERRVQAPYGVYTATRRRHEILCPASVGHDVAMVNGERSA